MFFEKDTHPNTYAKIDDLDVHHMKKSFSSINEE